MYIHWGTISLPSLISPNLSSAGMSLLKLSVFGATPCMLEIISRRVLTSTNDKHDKLVPVEIWDRYSSKVFS